MNDFDTIRDRTRGNSVKYGKPPVGAPENVLPMWMADMDFASPPPVREALEHAVKQEVYGYTEIDEAYWEGLVLWYRRRMRAKKRS